MRQKTVTVVGAAETTQLGAIPGLSQIQLHADAALNAMAECGLKPKDIDGIATAGETPVQIAHYLGITPTWVDGTSVGGSAALRRRRKPEHFMNAGLARANLIAPGSNSTSSSG